MKTLIVYFSLSGNTKKAAQLIHSVSGGDLFEIKGEKNYGGFAKACAIGGKELLTKEFPAVTSAVEDFGSYDRIILGFPIWYGSYPRIVQTFIEQYDFRGKEVYPFCTSTNAESSKAEAALRKAIDGATVHSAIRIVDQGQAEIQTWFEK